MTTLNKAIVFLGRTFAGHTHDYTMLKEEFPPEEAWFAFLQVLVDLGYQGILTDYVGQEIQVPPAILNLENWLTKKPNQVITMVHGKTISSTSIFQRMSSCLG
jgi:hypothetical protein